MSSESARIENTSKLFRNMFSNLQDPRRKEDGGGTPSLDESVLNFVNFYQSNKDRIDPTLIKKIIFSDLPNLCFERQIQDGAILSAILYAIHQLSASYLVLFIKIGGCVFKLLPPTEIRKRNEDKKGSFDFLTYFLHHAQRQRLTFDDVRFPEMLLHEDPVQVSKFVFFADSRCIMSLLQYGLRFCASDDQLIHPIFKRVAEFFAYLINNEDTVDGEAQDNYVEKICRFFRNFEIILLSTRNPHKVTIEMASILTNLTGFSDFDDIDPFLKYTFPELDFALYQPPRLQHSCRCAIRNRLRDSWNLPYGIWKLPLDRQIQRYLHYTVDERGHWVPVTNEYDDRIGLYASTAWDNAYKKKIFVCQDGGVASTGSSENVSKSAYASESASESSGEETLYEFVASQNVGESQPEAHEYASKRQINTLGSSHEMELRTPVSSGSQSEKVKYANVDEAVIPTPKCLGEDEFDVSGSSEVKCEVESYKSTPTEYGEGDSCSPLIVSSMEIDEEDAGDMSDSIVDVVDDGSDKTKTTCVMSKTLN